MGCSSIRENSICLLATVSLILFYGSMKIVCVAFLHQTIMAFVRVWTMLSSLPPRSSFGELSSWGSFKLDYRLSAMVCSTGWLNPLNGQLQRAWDTLCWRTTPCIFTIHLQQGRFSNFKACLSTKSLLKMKRIFIKSFVH